MTRPLLPIADGPAVRGYVRRLSRQHLPPLVGVLALHGLAVLAGLVTPTLLGELVDTIGSGTTIHAVDRLALGIVVSLVAQTMFVWLAALTSSVLAEKVLANLREDFVDRVLSIPLSTVARAGGGDLVSRTSRDVAILSRSVRRGVPETLTAIVTIVLTMGALAWLSLPLAMPSLIGLTILIGGSRWYLRRAAPAYLRENAASSGVMDGLIETVEGARATEALGTATRRRERTQRDLREAYLAQRATLRLRTVFWPTAGIGFMLPAASTLLVGGLLNVQGWASLGHVITAVAYVQRLGEPMDSLLNWLDELQVGAASLARLLGVSLAPSDRAVTGARPDGERITADGVHYSYVAGRDVLHDLTLAITPGERLALVGPSGAGKSTIGLLLAGVDGPRTGTVAVGGAPLVELPLEELRGHVALVTQQHHVFLGTLRENLVLGRPRGTDREIRAALAAVDALGWVDGLPDGLDTEVGPGRYEISPVRAQELALARLMLADPHTLVLDEATSLIDPTTARHLEHSLARTLEGRTVITIAHRLSSARYADRVAVVDNGRITELGSHDELIAMNGTYAALWRAWQS